MPLHVGLDVEPFAAHVAREFHVPGVLPLVLLEVVSLLVLFAASRKFTCKYFALSLRLSADAGSLPLPLCPMLRKMRSEIVGFGESSMLASGILAHVWFFAFMDHFEMPEEIVDPIYCEVAILFGAFVLFFWRIM